MVDEDGARARVVVAARLVRVVVPDPAIPLGIGVMFSFRGMCVTCDVNTLIAILSH